MVTKRMALEVYETQAALARALGVSKQAVSHWADDDPLPWSRRYQLHTLLPDKFPAPDVSELRNTTEAA